MRVVIILNTDKELLKDYIKKRRYSECIEILNKNIKKDLIKKVKKKDTNFEYVNLPNLRSRCLNLLDDKYISVVNQFCELHIEEVNEEYTIMKLMKLLKELNE